MAGGMGRRLVQRLVAAPRGGQGRRPEAENAQQPFAQHASEGNAAATVTGVFPS